MPIIYREDSSHFGWRSKYEFLPHLWTQVSWDPLVGFAWSYPCSRALILDYIVEKRLWESDRWISRYLRSKIGYDNFRVDVWYENCGTRRLVQIGKVGAISKKTTILCKLALLQSLRAKMNDKLAGTMVRAVFAKFIFFFYSLQGI